MAHLVGFPNTFVNTLKLFLHQELCSEKVDLKSQTNYAYLENSPIQFYRLIANFLFLSLRLRLLIVDLPAEVAIQKQDLFLPDYAPRLKALIFLVYQPRPRDELTLDREGPALRPPFDPTKPRAYKKSGKK